VDSPKQQSEKKERLMAKNPYGITKAAPPSKKLDIKLQTARPMQTLNVLKGKTLEQTLNLDTLQPELSAKMEALNTNTVNTSTVDRFIDPIQGVIEGFLGSLHQQTEHALTTAQGWRDKWALAREQRRAERIANLLEKVDQELRRGRWSAALRLINQVLKIDGNVYVAIYLKVLCLAGLHQLDEAIHVASDGVRRCDDFELAMAFEHLLEQLRAMKMFLPILVGIAAMMQGDIRQAIRSFAEALALNPRQPDVLLYKAICQMRLGKIKEAEESLREAERLDKSAEMRQIVASLREDLVLGGVKLLIDKATADMEAGRWMDALKTWVTITGNNGKDGRPYFYAAICWVKLAEAELTNYSPDRDKFMSSISAAKFMLDQAERYSDRSERELQQAISNLRSQLP
jgi:tetratricopeptide (TPR) repeat protein